VRHVPQDSRAGSDGSRLGRDRRDRPRRRRWCERRARGGRGGVRRARLAVVRGQRGDGSTRRPDRPLRGSRRPGPQFGIESIIGLDKRKQVLDTTTFPARAIAKITFTGGGCTGFMIGRNTVATAGHCVAEDGVWRTNVRVYPGRNGDDTPFGSCSARNNSQPGVGLFTSAEWFFGEDEEYDYGAIKLDCEVGNATGWFGLWTTNLVGTKTTVSGYPGDKPAGTQWLSNDCSNFWFTFHHCTVAVQTSRQAFYANDTFNGVSGAPVYFTTRSGCICAIAIHAYGLHGGDPHDVYNHGARTRKSVIGFLWDVRDLP
jgi:glutamyl endopeptidase